MDDEIGHGSKAGKSKRDTRGKEVIELQSWAEDGPRYFFIQTIEVL
jgi:hypothetical protein